MLWAARIRLFGDSVTVKAADYLAWACPLTSSVAVELAAVLTEWIETAAAVVPWAAHSLS